MLSFLLSNNASSNSIISNLEIEDGFSIEIFVDEIDTPRQIAESDEGLIFVGSRSGGVIYAIDQNKNKRIIANNLSNSTGVTFHDGDLYQSIIDSLTVSFRCMSERSVLIVDDFMHLTFIFDTFNPSSYSHICFVESIKPKKGK